MYDNHGFLEGFFGAAIIAAIILFMCFIGYSTGQTEKDYAEWKAHCTAGGGWVKTSMVEPPICVVNGVETAQYSVSNR